MVTVCCRNWNGPTAPSRLFFEHDIATTTSRVFEALGPNMPDGTEDWSSVVVEYTDNAFSPLPTGKSRLQAHNEGINS